MYFFPSALASLLLEISVLHIGQLNVICAGSLINLALLSYLTCISIRKEVYFINLLIINRIIIVKTRLKRSLIYKYFKINVICKTSPFFGGRFCKPFGLLYYESCQALIGAALSNVVGAKGFLQRTKKSG